MRNAESANFPPAPVSSSQLSRQLWQARISTPEDEIDELNRYELEQIIEQIRSVQFKPREKTAEPVILLKVTPTIEPNKAPQDGNAPSEPAKKEVEYKPPYKLVSAKTLQTLKDQAQHPEQVRNPLQLAEILFLSGNKKEAVTFYKEALNRQSADNLWSAHDKAWILFQIGNCLREDDPQTARKAYARLITEYPDLPWADLAKAKDKLLEWYETDKPRTLIDEQTRRDLQAPLSGREQQ
ncbi:MAG: tetratricopeptide repeat protein [Planctomycetota bacterium]|jgi:TolA-binding protein